MGTNQTKLNKKNPQSVMFLLALRMIKSRQKLDWIQLLNERKFTRWELCLYSFSPEGYPRLLNVDCLELKQKYTDY